MVRMISFKEQALYQKENGTQKQVTYIALELVSGGELFDFVDYRNFDPPICRFFLKQMLHALHYVHSNKATHRDLKPENIMLDD